MARTNNMITEVTSGSIGKSIVFRRQAGRTVMAKHPGPRTTPLTGGQVQVQKRFFRAAVYAKSVMNDPAAKERYAAAANGKLSTYNLTPRDAFKSPETEAIAAPEYFGNLATDRCQRKLCRLFHCTSRFCVISCTAITFFMKKILPFASLIFFFAACEKDAAVSTNPLVITASTITSVSMSDTTAHTVSIDSFEYDGNNRLKSYYRIFVDSSVDPVNTITAKYVFSYSGNDSLPVSITKDTEKHILAYDDQHRITKDSVTGVLTYYISYADGVFYTTLALPASVGTFRDTFTLYNGNVISHTYTYFMSEGVSHNELSFVYSSITNPLHNLKGMGILMHCLAGNDLDYISKNLFSSWENYSASGQGDEWVLSGQQVISGRESFAGLHYLVNFRYR